ncbi:unnamed protein product [Taenia asiatica]|uniref:DDE_Tnp_1_7 domain-containing protein n=1 Tax=Taenia asiatica TaxID=60517 RepID=A0A158R739_TAEAS|nr:unnamed protein product [Taenia asiatica]
MESVCWEDEEHIYAPDVIDGLRDLTTLMVDANLWKAGLNVNTPFLNRWNREEPLCGKITGKRRWMREARVKWHHFVVVEIEDDYIEAAQTIIPPTGNNLPKNGCEEESQQDPRGDYSGQAYSMRVSHLVSATLAKD